GTNLEGDILKLARAGEALYIEDGFARRAGGVLREVIGDGASDHHLDDLVLGAGRPGLFLLTLFFAESADVFAIAEDRDRIAEAEDLRHAVGDVDHGDPPPAAGF